MLHKEFLQMLTSAKKVFTFVEKKMKFVGIPLALMSVICHVTKDFNSSYLFKAALVSKKNINIYFSIIIFSFIFCLFPSAFSSKLSIFISIILMFFCWFNEIILKIMYMQVNLHIIWLREYVLFPKNHNDIIKYWQNNKKN